jgi:hypothetical protein
MDERERELTKKHYRILGFAILIIAIIVIGFIIIISDILNPDWPMVG